MDVSTRLQRHRHPKLTHEFKAPSALQRHALEGLVGPASIGISSVLAAASEAGM